VKIARFEDIDAWKQARFLTRGVYEASAGREFYRDSELRDQMRAAAGSVMHNIAEGFDSGRPMEFVRFLRYALRSASEVQSQLYIALDLQYIATRTFRRLYDDANAVKGLIGGFIRYLKARPSERQSPGPSAF
jgi:S23 ribosomal protein.